MKKGLLLILFLLHGIVFSQGVIPKNANTIIISDTLTQDQLFNKVHEVLFEAGFGLQSYNKELGSITTNSKEFKNGSFRLNIFVKDKSVMIHGQWRWREWPDDSEEWDDILYGGQKSSPKMNSWNAMNDVAIQIPGKKEYLIK